MAVGDVWDEEEVEEKEGERGGPPISDLGGSRGPALTKAQPDPHCTSPLGQTVPL